MTSLQQQETFLLNKIQKQNQNLLKVNEEMLTCVDYRLFEYKKTQQFVLYQQLTSMLELKTSREALGIESQDCDSTIETIKYEMLIIQKDLMELSYSIYNYEILSGLNSRIRYYEPNLNCNLNSSYNKNSDCSTSINSTFIDNNEFLNDNYF